MDLLLAILGLPLPLFLLLVVLPMPRIFLPVWGVVGLLLGYGWFHEVLLLEPGRGPEGWGGALNRAILLAISWNWLMAAAVQILRRRLHRRGKLRSYPGLVVLAGFVVVLPYVLVLLRD